jgi:hypothetical protein
MTTPATLSLEDLAARWGRDKKWIAELIQAGKGPGVYSGRRYFIPVEAVERFEQGLDGFWSRAIAGLPEPVEEEPMPEHHFNYYQKWPTPAEIQEMYLSRRPRRHTQ